MLSMIALSELARETRVQLGRRDETSFSRSWKRQKQKGKGREGGISISTFEDLKVKLP